MKALGLVLSEIFENCILKTYFLTLWPTYAINWNGLKELGRGPPRDHSCEVWSKSNWWCQRRSCWKKLLTDARTDGQRTMGHHKSSPWGLSNGTKSFLAKRSVFKDRFAFSLLSNLFQKWEGIVLEWAVKSHKYKYKPNKLQLSKYINSHRNNSWISEIYFLYNLSDHLIT